MQVSLVNDIRTVSCLTGVVAAAFASALFPPVASAALTWDATNSTHTGTGGGFTTSEPFVTGGGSTNNGSGAKSFAAGTNLNGIYTLGFQQAFNPTPTMAQTDISGTPLIAGTTVTLFFNKDAGDNLNFVMVSGDLNAIVEYEVISDTRFRVTANVVNPVPTFGGDVAASFGVVVNYQANPQFDFQETVFATDMHLFDIVDVMDTINTGVMTVRARGEDGSNGILKAYVPDTFLPTLNAADASVIRGYVGGVEVPALDFVHIGPGTFDFSPTGTTTSGVQIFTLRNSAWSVAGTGKDLQIGKILPPSGDPNAALKAQLIKKIAKLKKQIRSAGSPKVAASLKAKLKKLTKQLRAL